MSVQRLTVAQIETAILEITHFSSSANAPWASTANLYLRINEYGQRLPMHLNSIAAQMGITIPVHFDMWKTSANSSTTGTDLPVVAASSSTVYLPANYDHWISFYDITNKRLIHVIEHVDRWHYEDLVLGPAGPPQYIEIGGMTTGDSVWRKTATLYPATLSGITPSIRLQYWRLPTIMSDAAHYPDVDAKYENLFIYGPVCDLTRHTDTDTYATYSALEQQLLTEMVMTARNV